MTRKTEPTVTFDGRAAGTPLPAASIFLARNFRRSFFLVVMVAGLACLQLRGNTNAAAKNYETPPPKIGSIQWSEMQRISKARQEQYRKRVAIPGAVARDVPHAEGFDALNRPPAPAAGGQSFSAAPEKFLKFVFFAGVFLMAGLLLVRKFAPHLLAEFNERFNPLATTPLPELAFTEKVRTEEEAFAEFVKKFKAASPISSKNVLTEKSERAAKFYALTPDFFSGQRVLMQNIVREPDEAARQKMLADLRAGMNELKTLADFPEVLPIWQAASAVEGLLRQLVGRVAAVTSSTLRTVLGGVDLLEDLCTAALQPHLLTDRPLKFLVVDDELLSRHAISLALNKAFSRPDVVVDGAAALVKAQEHGYDVIFLDVQMPGMDGFELCTKIRDTALNRATPVVFVTGHDDFDARAKSTLSGGNELMGKPFLTFEITVKALTLGLQRRLQVHAQKNGRSRELANPLPATADNARTPATPANDIWLPLPLPPQASSEMERFTNVFLARAEKQMEPLFEFCRKIHVALDEGERQTVIADAFLCINSLVSQASAGIIHPAYQMSLALEGLFRKLLESSKNYSSSTLATITAAVEVLDDLCAPGLKTDFASNPPVELLVVDDDLIARRALVGALQTAFNRPESVENGEAALARAAEKPFDVIFLDVIMPGMDGFEACSKIRQTVANHATPVVFVTSKNDAEAQAEMKRSGGNDLLGKPFLTSEITVKALTFALRGRLNQLKA